MQAHNYRLLIRSSHFTHVLDGIRHPVTLTNYLDEFVYVNPAFTARFSWREEEIVGLPSRILLPEDLPESKLKKLRQQIAEPSMAWVEASPCRAKNGDFFILERFTCSINLIENLPRNLRVGLYAEQGLITEAFSELLASLCRVSFRVKTKNDNQLKTLSKPDQIENLYAHGYSTKEIAGFMNLGHNTPHVIMHRARRKKM